MMRHGWHVLFLIGLSFSLLSCGNKTKEEEGNVTRWSTFPVPIATDPSLIPNADAADDFQKAMDFWESKIGKKIFAYQGNTWSGQPYNGGTSQSENSLYIHKDWSFAPNIAAQTIVLSQKKQIQSAVIMVNPSMQFCEGDCVGQSNRTSMRKVFAHELGHFIGLGHSQDPANIMYPDALPGGDISHLTVNAAELMPLIN